VPRVFVGNFDFEHELAGGQTQRSLNVQSISADLASAWVAVAEADDLIWSPTGVPTFDFREWQARSGVVPRFIAAECDLPRGPDWELVPWGWTASVLKWGQKFGWNCPAPSLDTVKRVNSRAFRAELELRLAIALPQSAILTSTDQLAKHLEDFANYQPDPAVAGWVLKANFGMSGRERQLGRGPRMTDPVLNWAKRRLQQSSAVVFEPWLDRVAEAGIQIDIPRAGEPQLLGVLPLLTDPTGTYRGSRIQCRDSDLQIWQSAATTALQVAREVQSAGYFGPLGIDAMQYRDRDGRLQIRPLQDLNARYTMGRLGLGLRRCITNHKEVDWLHDPRLIATSQASIPESKVIPITEKSWLLEYRRLDGTD
jgi:hypothetical protein